MNNDVIIFLIGPTCTDKTKLAIKLMTFFPIEIISVDASMIYKYMNIGTGKPSYYFLNKFKHNLVNICDPCENYSILNFCKDALLIIKSCWERGKIPFFVGGSMMYFWLLQKILYFFNNNNIIFHYNINNFNLLYDKIDIFKIGINTIYKKDIIYYLKWFYYNNLNVVLNKIYTNSLKFINIAILPIDKNKLYNRIENRFKNMLQMGFVDEVYCLYKRGDLNLASQSIKSIGYKDFWLYFDNKISFKDATESILFSTYNLSNRQLMWLKKWKSDLIYLEFEQSNILNNISFLINKNLV